MGTTVHVQPGHAIGFVEPNFKRVEDEMSEWKENSTLTEVNRLAGKKPVKCSKELIEVVQQAVDVAEITSGAFDPTWTSLWKLWDFKNPRVPSQNEVTSILPLVNWEEVVLTDDTIFLTQEGMMIGLGGIAKGVALNQSRDALLNNGIDNFMIVLGGQILVNGDTRTIGIRTPDGSPTDFIATVELKDASISTSGDYEKYFEVDGVRYHHIIDPRTGFPTSNGVRSVTVVSTNAAVADAYSTALFVLGVEQGIALAEQTDDLEAFFIEDGNKVTQSSGFKALQSSSKTSP